MKTVTPDPLLHETPIVRNTLLRFPVTLLDPVLLMQSFDIIIGCYPSPNQSRNEIQSKEGSYIYQQTVNCISNTFNALLLVQPLLCSNLTTNKSRFSHSKMQARKIIFIFFLDFQLVSNSNTAHTAVKRKNPTPLPVFAASNFLRV